MDATVYLAGYPAERLHQEARSFATMLENARAAAPELGEFDPHVGPFIEAASRAVVERKRELARRDDLAQAVLELGRLGGYSRGHG
jgi:hypothetical protein